MRKIVRRNLLGSSCWKLAIAREREEEKTISTEIEFFTTWCSCCPSASILIIPKGQGKVGGKSAINPEAISEQQMHFIADGISPPTNFPQTQFHPRNFDFLLAFRRDENQMKSNSISVWFVSRVKHSQPARRRNQRGKYLWNGRINITVHFNLFIFLSLARRTLLS